MANLKEVLFLLRGAVPGTLIAQPPHRRELVETFTLDLRRVVVGSARGLGLHSVLVRGVA